MEVTLFVHRSYHIILSQVKGSRKLYDILMKTNALPNSTNKWQGI